MTDSFAIRPATLDDVTLIVAHRRRMFEDMGYTNLEGLAAMDQVGTEWLRERLANGRYLGWFAVAPGGRVAAGAGLWLQDWPPTWFDQQPYRGYILNVYTEPDYRRRGLARRLVQTINDWCAEQGIVTVTLHASKQGRSIYESLGYRPTNEMRLFVKAE